MSTPNWANLYYQGRCKAVGVPWNEEEANAVFQLKIPVEYVRMGIVTKKQYDEQLQAVEEYVKKHGEKPLKFMKREELVQVGKAYGLEFNLVHTTDETLRELITLKRDKVETASGELLGGTAKKGRPRKDIIS